MLDDDAKTGRKDVEDWKEVVELYNAGYTNPIIIDDYKLDNSASQED